MILGVGIDIIDNRRFKRWMGDNELLKRYFSEEEINLCLRKPSPCNSLAARFAAKEALIKASGLSLNLKEIVLLNDLQGKICLATHAQAQYSLKKLGVKSVHVSLSHERHYSVAYVVLEK